MEVDGSHVEGAGQAAEAQPMPEHQAASAAAPVTASSPAPSPAALDPALAASVSAGEECFSTADSLQSDGHENEHMRTSAHQAPKSLALLPKWRDVPPHG